MALTANQLSTQFQSQIGRDPTDYEVSNYQNASPQTIASLKDTYANYDQNSLSGYMQANGLDTQTAQELANKYGITGVGTMQGNAALLAALKGGNPAQTNPVQGSLSPAPVAPLASEVNPTQTPQANDPTVNANTGSSSSNPIQSNQDTTDTPNSQFNQVSPTGQYTPGSGQTMGGSISAAAGGSSQSPQDPVALAQQNVNQAYQSMQETQKQIASIDATLASVKSERMAAIAAEGGVVDEAALTSEIYAENQPLLAQRAALASTYTAANQAYQKSVTDYNDTVNQAKSTAQLAQGQEKIDNQASQFTQKEQDVADKLAQAGWKEEKTNVYDEYGNVTGQTVTWTQNPANGGAAAPTGNVSGIPQPTGTGSNAAKNIAPSGLTDYTMSLSQVIQKFGLNSIINGIIQNEGGSLPGVQNNPGNIKFMGLPGQTNSGVSNDGGKSTFANYSSYNDGLTAIGIIVTNAASGKSSVYGQNPTFQDFVNKYTNTTPSTSNSGATANSTSPALNALTTSSSVDISTPGYTTAEVTVDGKNTQLTQAYIDQIAVSAIMNGGTIPSSVSRATKGLPVVQMDAIKQRIGQLDPGGNLALNKTEAQAWGKTITTQIAYATTLQRSLSSADADFQQILTKYQGTGINDQSMPISNLISNASKYGLGDGDVSAFKASLAELANVYQQVFSRSGTVTDAVRQQSQDILDGNISIANLQKVSDQLQALGKIDLTQANDTVTSAENSYKGIVPADDNSAQNQNANPGSGGIGPKGSQTDQQFVESALDAINTSYNSFIASVPKGQKAVVDNSTGVVGVIPDSEFDPSLYTPM